MRGWLFAVVMMVAWVIPAHASDMASSLDDNGLGDFKVAAFAPPELGIHPKKKGGGGDDGSAGKPFRMRFHLIPYIPVTFYKPSPRENVRVQIGLGLKTFLAFVYQKPVGFEGDIRAAIKGYPGPRRTGWEFRSGVRIGPRFMTKGRFQVGFSILSGVEFLGDQYKVDEADLQSVYLDTPQAWMVGVPMMGKLSLAIVHLQGGVIPWWFIANNGNRPAVNWSNPEQDVKGFGDEFEIVGAVTVDVLIMRITLSASHRVTGYGENTSAGLGLGFGFGGKRKPQ